MSSPLPDISATSPGDALGDSAQAPLPQIGVGSRGKRGKASGGLLNRIGGMRAPGAPAQAQAQARQHLQVVRPQQAPPPNQPPPNQPPPRTGPNRRNAPNGRTAAYRQAMNTVIGQRPRHTYQGMPAANQNLYNQGIRHHARQLAGVYNQGGAQALQQHLARVRGQQATQAGPRRQGAGQPQGQGMPPQVRARRAQQFQQMRQQLNQMPPPNP